MGEQKRRKMSVCNNNKGLDEKTAATATTTLQTQKKMGKNQTEKSTQSIKLIRRIRYMAIRLKFTS